MWWFRLREGPEGTTAEDTVREAGACWKWVEVVVDTDHAGGFPMCLDPYQA